MDKWQEYQLGNIASMQYGKMPKKELVGTGDYPIYSGYKYQLSYPEKNCNKGDIIVVARGVGGTGEVKIVKQDSFLTNLSIKITFNINTVDNEFFYYCFNKNNLKYLDSGSAQSQITINDMCNLYIKLPKLNEQKSIASILSSLDNKIDNLQKQNETLEQIAQTLFKQWFVEFEFPYDFAQGKPSGDGKPYKSSGGKMVESELGEIPEGWRVGKLGEEVETLGGGTPKTKEPSYWENGNILWYSPTDLTKSNSMFSFNSAKKINKLGLQKSSAKLFSAYSILLTSRATVGVLAINTKKACTNQGFITTIPNNKYSLYYLYEWIKFQIPLIKRLASGSTFPEISKTDYRNLDFIIPSSEILKNYDKTIKPIVDKIEINLKKIDTLTNTRDTLLPELMSGEIRVK